MASQGIMANQRAAGGGSSGPDISQATATPDKVWAGETFFAGENEEMQTGTLDIPAATATPGDVLSGATFFAGDTTDMQTGTLRPSELLLQKTGTVTVGSSSSATVSCDFAVTSFCFLFGWSGGHALTYYKDIYGGNLTSSINGVGTIVSVFSISGNSVTITNASGFSISCSYVALGY